MDGDFEEEDIYGIVANRSISEDGAYHIQDSLARAAKDPHLIVEIIGPRGAAQSTNPEKFKAMLDSVRAATGPRPKVLPEDRMDWHRSFGWSISAKKSNPLFSPAKGEKTKDGDPASVHTKIYDYIHDNYKL